MNAISANDTDLPGASIPAVTYPAVDPAIRARLYAFAADTGTTPPQHILVDEYGDGGTFTTEFLAYCTETGLSLDWAWFGEGPQTVVRENRT